MLTEADELTPSPPPSRSLFGIGFREPAAPPPSPLPSPSSSPENTPSLGGPELDSEDDEWDAATPPPSPEAATSSPAPSPAPSPDVAVVDSEALRDMARAGVAIAGHQAHQVLARTDGQKAVGLYLTDDDDQAGIGDPLARIAGRHQGIGQVSEDTKDVLAALVSIARFATKTTAAAKHAKALDLAATSTPQEHTA